MKDPLPKRSTKIVTVRRTRFKKSGQKDITQSQGIFVHCYQAQSR